MYAFTVERVFVLSLVYLVLRFMYFKGLYYFLELIIME